MYVCGSYRPGGLDLNNTRVTSIREVKKHAQGNIVKGREKREEKRLFGILHSKLTRELNMRLRSNPLQPNTSLDHFEKEKGKVESKLPDNGSPTVLLHQTALFGLTILFTISSLSACLGTIDFPSKKGAERGVVGIESLSSWTRIIALGVFGLKSGVAGGVLTLTEVSTDEK